MIPVKYFNERQYRAEAFLLLGGELKKSDLLKELFKRGYLGSELNHIERMSIKIVKARRLDKYRGYWK